MRNLGASCLRYSRDVWVRPARHGGTLRWPDPSREGACRVHWPPGRRRSSGTPREFCRRGRRRGLASAFLLIRRVFPTISAPALDATIVRRGLCRGGAAFTSGSSTRSGFARRSGCDTLWSTHVGAGLARACPPVRSGRECSSDARLGILGSSICPSPCPPLLTGARAERVYLPHWLSRTGRFWRTVPLDLNAPVVMGLAAVSATCGSRTQPSASPSLVFTFVAPYLDSR